MTAPFLSAKGRKRWPLWTSPMKKQRKGERKDVMAKMRDTVKVKEVVALKELAAPPRKKARDEAEEVMQGIRTAHRISASRQSWRCAGLC